VASALNGDATRRVALVGVHEDADGTHNVFGISGAADGRHTTGIRAQVVGIEGDAYHSAAGTSSNLIGVAGFAEMDGVSGTVTDMMALRAFTNVKSAGTVDNNYGLLIDDQAGVGTNNWALRTMGTALSQFGGAVDTGVGFRVSGAATTGRFLRGNGTNFIASSGAASGTGGCTNQFVKTLNDDAAPTCASVATADITDGNVTPGKLSTAARSIEKAVSWENPTTVDSYKWMVINPATAITLTRVYCAVLGGTSVTINLRKTSESTPFSGGTAALTSNLVCDADGANSTTFTSAGVAANTPLMVEVTAVSGSVTNIIIGIHGTRD
jgi:hypothetical protein